MKKTVLIAALTLMSVSAHASKARLSALSSAAHLTDFQTIFSIPNDLHSIGEQATFEFGSSSATLAQVGAEGGFVKKADNAIWGFYLGRKADSMKWGFSKIDPTFATFQNEQNPFDLAYGSDAGDIKYGVNFHYSNSDKKTTKQKTNSMGITAGAQSGAWNAQLGMGLGGSATNSATAGTDVKMTMTTAMSLTGGYQMDAIYVYGGYVSLGAKKETGSTENSKHTKNTTYVGMVNSMKKDGTDFFYGVEYNMDTEKESVGNAKTETTTLPVKIGVEAEAASWLALRASVSQNVLLGSTKTDPNDADTIANNTTVAAGMGLKFGKFMFEGTVSKAGNATPDFGLDGGNFLSNASMTYTF